MARPYAVEAFAGAGLLSLGFTIEGFNVAEFCERDRAAVQTLRWNHPNSEITRCDAFQWEPRAAPGTIDLMFGGPPCQGFSQAGLQEGPDYKDHGYPVVLHWAKKYRPRYMVWENVSRVLAPKWEEWRQDWWRKIKRMGYEGVAWNLLAADYGTPQARARAFFVLWRKGDERARKILSEPPPPTHARPELAKETGLPVWVTGHQRLHEGCCGRYALYSCAYLNNLSNTCARCIQGDHWAAAPNETFGDVLDEDTLKYILRDPERVTSKHVPVDMSGTMAPLPKRWLLAPTMTANMQKGASYSLVVDPAAIVSTKEDLHELVTAQRETGSPGVRRLSVREAAKLQDVPQWYVFQGGVSTQYRQVGNGVPVNLARAVARHLLRAMGRRVPPSSLARDPYSALWRFGDETHRCLAPYREIMETLGHGRPGQLTLIRTPSMKPTTAGPWPSEKGE